MDSLRKAMRLAALDLVGSDAVPSDRHFVEHIDFNWRPVDVGDLVRATALCSATPEHGMVLELVDRNCIRVLYPDGCTGTSAAFLWESEPGPMA